MGTLENSSYPVIVPGENLDKYGGVGLLGTMGTILYNSLFRNTITWIYGSRYRVSLYI